MREEALWLMAVRQARLEPLALSGSGHERMVTGWAAASGEKKFNLFERIARFGDILEDREADHRDRTPFALSQFGRRHQAVASGEGSAHNLTPLVPTDGGVGREAGEQWPGDGGDHPRFPGAKK